MPFSLIPKLILPSLTDLTPELLAARGVRFLMLDFDNTIVPYTTNEPAEAMTAWLRRMQASEIRLCVVSSTEIYTDVLGANCAGMTSILVSAIHNHTIWLKLRHIAELPFIAIGRRKIQHEKH